MFLKTKLRVTRKLFVSFVLPCVQMIILISLALHPSIYVCMYVCITHNHKVIVEALISERIVNDVSESNSIVCCMRESMQGKTRPTFDVRNP